MKNVALIVAAGTGERMLSTIPKQYLQIAEKTVLRHTIEKFLNHPEIDVVKVVINKQHVDLYKEAVSGLDLLPYTFGGEHRQQSVLFGLRDLQDLGIEKVLIHDSVRPFISDRIISDVVYALDEVKVVDVGIKPKDTIKDVSNGVKLLDRTKLYQTQTPQGFDFKTILDLHERLQDMKFTDDVSLALSDGMDVKVIEGSETNLKITTNTDLQYIEGTMSGIVKVGFGFDIHRFFDKSESDAKIILGGIEIPCEYRIEAHSDGDLVLHAITDALLGTLGAGDIGDHFPPSDNKWKNADSSIFLKAAVAMLKMQGGSINNVDITIICETPKLYGYKQKIQQRIAEILEINYMNVTVKGRTSEKIGAIGRSEGIVAQVVCAVNYK